MSDTRRDKLAAFVSWCADHVTGDEKGQAQIFLDRLFQAFGQKGSLDVGGSPEMRVKKDKEDGGGTAFADYVWKPVVLIEMKRRGVDLRRHRKQMFDYWVRLVPGRPRYAVLCNFDQFAVYDFDRQVDEPVDTLALTDLPDRWGPLAFLFPTNEKPTFDNDREKVTREAADHLAACYTRLEKRGIDPSLRQRFILQALVATFAEDIGLLPKYMLANLLDECATPAASYDLIGGLFEAMNRDGGNPGGRYKGVRYFNGGIFVEPARIELDPSEIGLLKKAGESDWSKVSPEIFGTLFEHSMGKEDRHAFGAHYTSQIDILKIVNPTIVNPWAEAIDAARTGPALLKLLARLTTLRVLDPACGSGNFLYVAYRQMKELEARIRERLAADFPATQATLLHVNARQFFGLDVNPFAVELAKVTMMIGRKLAIDELHIADEADLPLDNLDENFRCVDALISPSPGTPGVGRGQGASTAERPAAKTYVQTPWPPADVIIGNPPFVDARRISLEHGRAYSALLRMLYSVVPGRADYCVYWFRRSHDHLPDDGRAGLVGTKTISQNYSREGGLDYIVANGGTIFNAVASQPWSGEAAVDVAIVNWTKASVKGSRLLYVQTSAGDTREPVPVETNAIPSSLTLGTDVTRANILASAYSPKVCFEGQQPGHDGFRLAKDERAELLSREPSAAVIVHPYINGQELLTAEYATAPRYIIDMGDRSILQASEFPKTIAMIQRRVLPTWQTNADAEQVNTGRDTGEHQSRLQVWWRLKRRRGELLSRLAALPRYVVCARVTKRPIFCFLSTQVHPDSQLTCFTFADDFSFGVLQSGTHWQWFVSRCSTLSARFRYTSDTVFDTFPWPQSPTSKQIDAVAAAGREVRRVRAAALAVIPGGLRAVYRTLELPGKHPLKDAHAALDAAVLAAYGFSTKADLLKQLLDLNHAVAAAEAAGRAVTAPGVPPGYGDPAALVTDDCIRPN